MSAIMDHSEKGLTSRILIVEDEPAIADALSLSLTSNGYAAISVATSEAALKALAQTPPDLMLLDLGLPGSDGKDVLKSLRAWSDLPVIILTARHEIQERIEALDLGADDYVTKPFDLRELHARIRTALRRRVKSDTAPRFFEARGLKVDFEARRVWFDGLRIHFTPKEYALFKVLVLNAGRVVTHKQLLAAGWGDENRDPQFLRIFVSQLRQKLEADLTRPALIINEPGIGYRFDVED